MTVRAVTFATRLPPVLAERASLWSPPNPCQSLSSLLKAAGTFSSISAGLTLDHGSGSPCAAVSLKAPITHAHPMMLRGFSRQSAGLTEICTQGIVIDDPGPPVISSACRRRERCGLIWDSNAWLVPHLLCCS
jgi:hypothetical protein